MRISDWSSDVCSSDLRRHASGMPGGLRRGRRTLGHCAAPRPGGHPAFHGDRKSVVWGKSVSVRVDLGGRRIIKKKRKKLQQRKDQLDTYNLSSPITNTKNQKTRDQYARRTHT